MPYDGTDSWEIGRTDFKDVMEAIEAVKEEQGRVLAKEEGALQTEGILKKMLDSCKKVQIPENPAKEVRKDCYFQTDLQIEMLVWYARNSNSGGDGDNTVALDPIHHFNLTDLLARFFIQSHCRWGTVANWRDCCIGVTSFSMLPRDQYNYLHMPMFDYDGKNVRAQIRKDVKALQKDYGLGNAWVYETQRGFHVYFFCDAVKWDKYASMLKMVKACDGFKNAALNRGYAVLRVSAKYTNFDIELLYVLISKDETPRRMNRKAHTIQALIELGHECGTHFASMFPKWAYFQQDSGEWRPPLKGTRDKRSKKTRLPEPKCEGGIDPENYAAPPENKVRWTDTLTTSNTGTYTTDTSAFVAAGYDEVHVVPTDGMHYKYTKF